VEKIATGTLGLRTPEPRRVRIVPPRGCALMLERQGRWRLRSGGARFVLERCWQRSVVLGARSLYWQALADRLPAGEGDAR